MPLAASGTPERLSERCRVGIVLDRNANVEFVCQSREELLTLPTGQIFDISNEARLRIYRTGASNADPGNFLPCFPRGLSQHRGHSRNCIGETRFRICRTFHAAQDSAILVHNPHSNFCAADINCADHLLAVSAETRVVLDMNIFTSQRAVWLAEVFNEGEV